MLTPEQTADFVTFVTSNTTNYTHTDPGQAPLTKTISEWVSGGFDAVVSALLNNQAFGASLDKTVGRASISSSDIKAALATGAEFATMPKSDLQFLIDGNPTFPLNHAGMVAAVDTVLEPYPGVAAAFNALKQKSASIAESITRTEGFAVSVDDAAQIRTAAGF
jgi:hypothetical protein